jgi:hypothetical protein
VHASSEEAGACACSTIWWPSIMRAKGSAGRVVCS